MTYYNLYTLYKPNLNQHKIGMAATHMGSYMPDGSDMRQALSTGAVAHSQSVMSNRKLSGTPAGHADRLQKICPADVHKLSDK